ncbi:recombinase family protein [Yokenella regensburgei]|nr:recombinase family protein [Yokenella regensburgei]
MTLYGYARVSTSDQDLTLQTQTVRTADCEINRAEKASGSSRTGKSELQLLLEFLRPGDTLMVTHVPRLLREHPAVSNTAPVIQHTEQHQRWFAPGRGRSVCLRSDGDISNCQQSLLFSA